ncbi:MAG: aminotransferase class V-fold PLP-dependent enzyme [Eggerthellaceae bacterium]|nr:aminotransferase class V-fold PLP-dependent enzyme [Eggerthellaceae bacterium]
MIYFDNAATTMLKPPSVAQAVAAAINEFGGAGRGVHEASLASGMAIYNARAAIAHLLGAPDPKHVCFALNVTEALNCAIAGLLHAGDHAITTAASHNSVLRPLYRKVDEEGVQLDVLPVAPDASIDYAAFEALFRPNTKAVVATHASNLTGDVYDIARMAAIAHDHGALFVLDAAQTAGSVPTNMVELGVDVLCFTGHKSLFGPQGTGGLCLGEGVDLPAFKEGGSGTHSYDRRHPDFYPEHLEAGTLNGHGIAGLAAGVAFIEGVGVEAIHRHTLALSDRFETGVRDLPGVRIYGGHADVDRTGIVALNIGDVDSGAVSDLLNAEYGICTRAGAHCAPLMHKALGTEGPGAVRFSFGYLNTEEEVDEGIRAIAEIVAEVA